MMRSLAVTGLIAGLAGLAVVPFGLDRYGVFILTLWLVQTIAAMGLNLTLGYAGQVSLAQAAFLGIGAYSAALLTTAGLPWIAGAGLAVVLCFVIGLALGFPALRVQHHYLAFVTLAFTTLVWLVMRNEEWLTNGTYGVYGIPRPEVLGIATSDPVAFFHFVLVVTVALSATMWWLVRSPWGRAFTALRENAVRAESLGVDTRRYTLLAFAIGAVYGGLAGALYAPLVEFIDPNPFNLATSLSLLLAVVVGGAGYFAGPFLGAGLAVLLPEWLRIADDWYLLSYAFVVMILLAICPTGLLGLLHRGLDRLRRPRAGAAGDPAKEG
jgi:branched-chain amino acid transport system permease protein